MVHRLHDRCDLRESVHREMAASRHQLDDRRELPKLMDFRGSQRVISEERDDPSTQIGQPSDDVPGHVLPVVVVATIGRHASASEERLQVLENRDTPNSLHDDELGLNLPTQARLRVPEDRNTEASFAVDEADDPLLESRPFLLIARTRRIVTAHISV